MIPSPIFASSPGRSLRSLQGEIPLSGAAVNVSDTPVLAFGGGLTALGVMRSLRQSGIRVYSICPPGDLASNSRWFRAAPGCNGRIPEPHELAEFLETLPVRNAVLFPCSDDWVRAIAELPPALKHRFPASVPEPKVVEALTDKWKFSTLVECLDIPRPRTIRVASMPELLALSEDAFDQMFLKPIDSQEFSRRNNAKAFRIQGKRHAVGIMQSVMDSGGSAFPILLQEFVPGGADDYYLVDGFVDRRGISRAWMARRRLSQYPPHFGNSARSQTIPLHQVQSAVDALDRMWSRVHYRGIFDAEFKYDRRDGQLKILEINARPWWFVEFATRCRVDLCKMAFLDALELPVPSLEHYDIGRRCVHVTYDLAAHLGDAFAFDRLWSWMRSCRGVEDIVYRWDDPWPGIRSALSSLKRHGIRGLITPGLTVPPPPGKSS